VKTTRPVVISMRLPAATGSRLKRLASARGWSNSDAGARLVEEGLRRTEFAFIDFRDSALGRQACVQGSSLAVWEVMLLLRAYHGAISAVAKHLRWPESKVHAAANYATAFPHEIEEALSDNAKVDLAALKRPLPQAEEYATGKKSKR